jgi:16S rRNA (cytosine1402-N4)-methyltransferase
MKHSATLFDRHDRQAPATWPLPDTATLAYFPNARFAVSDGDLGAGDAFRLGPFHEHPNPVSGAFMDDDDSGRFGHVPVLLDRCVELLLPALTRHGDDGSGAVLIDGTLGAGGHTERFLTQLPGLRVIGLDRDPSALAIAGERLARFGDRFTPVRTRYDAIADALAEIGYPATGSIDGVLFDLGVSSMQLDRTERGFSYSADAPLDMRMDPDLPLTAADILNTYDKAALTRILREFGDERFAPRIAGFVIRRREQRPFTTTGDHPAKRTFQALRVAVNAELDSLHAALPAALDALAVGGRAVVMAYQSLEDRIVKSVFTEATASRTPAGLPVELPGYEPEFESLIRGAERADADEIERNPRSAPVRLRAVQRVTGRGRP